MGAICSCCFGESSDTRTKYDKTAPLLNECDLPQSSQPSNRIDGGSTTANGRTTTFGVHVEVIMGPTQRGPIND